MGDEQDRPEGACRCHRPPRPGRHWRPADPPHLTCADCLNHLHRLLSPSATDDDGHHIGIPALWCQLDPRHVRGEQGRRGPGFGSRSPARDHVISLRDPRSTGDDRLLSTPGVLTAWAELVADERHVRIPPRTVPDLAEFVSRHLDWLARQDYIDELATELRTLASQLRSAAGDPKPKPIAHCIAWPDDAEQECGAPIYMPAGKPRAPDEPIADLPALECKRCGADYRGAAIIRLRLANERQAS